MHDHGATARCRGRDQGHEVRERAVHATVRHEAEQGQAPAFLLGQREGGGVLRTCPALCACCTAGLRASRSTSGRSRNCAASAASPCTSIMLARLRISRSAADCRAALMCGSTRTLTTSDLPVAIDPTLCAER